MHSMQCDSKGTSSSFNISVECDSDGVISQTDDQNIKSAAGDQTPVEQNSTRETLLLAYQSIGVVYGDLVTSPVNVFSATTLDLSEEDLLGTFSLIFWTLTIIVLIKYVFVVLHANDNGEGGTFAMYSYLSRHIDFEKNRFIIQRPLKLRGSDDDEKCRSYKSIAGLKMKRFLERNSKAQDYLVFVVLMGTCMVIGDGALTPATCVLSAIQGIQSCSPKITQGHVVIISVALIIVLFLFQHYGTSKVSFIFSPVMILWLVTNAAIGIYNVCKHYPSILKAISPHYIFLFISRDAKSAWTILGAVFLGITGAEAMFTDLGHFNKKAIQWAFSFVVYPTLMAAYAGETAYLIKHPENITNAYYSSIPRSVYWPMFAISTLAAIVASQSMISASFSIVKQSQALNCFPRVTLLHTSAKYKGQVYSPQVNYGLMILCVGLVVGFKGGTALANAYGVVVIWVMIITTMLTTLVMLVIWDTHVLLVLAFFVPYILIEGAFMTSLMNKIPQGGWVPFAISAILGTIMLSWTYGRSKLSKYESEHKISAIDLNQMVSGVCRTPGIRFFLGDMDGGDNAIPPVFRCYVENTSSVSQAAVIVSAKTMDDVAYVVPEERFCVEKLGMGDEGVYGCLVKLGYMECLDLGESGHIGEIVGRFSSEVGENIEGFFVVGRMILSAKQNQGWLHRFIINYVYKFLDLNSRASVTRIQVPIERTMQIGMLCEV